MNHEDHIPKCKGCQEDIDTDSDCVIQAVNADWHPSCFRCSRCQNQLSTWYVQKTGRLLCRRDYWAKYRHLCNGCSVVISGPVMVAGEHRYHPECFQCCHCSVCIGQDEAYVLLERSSLYCGHCFHSNVTTGTQTVQQSTFPPPPPPPQQPPPSSSPSSSSAPTTIQTVTLTVTSPMTNTTSPLPVVSIKPRRSPHTIHLVKLPPPVISKENHTHSHREVDDNKDSTHQTRTLTQPKGGVGHGKDHINDDDDEKTTGPDIKDDDDDEKTTGPDTKDDDDDDANTASHPCGLRLSILRVGSHTDSGGSVQDGGYRHSFVLEGGRMGPHTRIVKLDKSRSDLQALEVGDCILEVNGSSIRDRSLKEICDVICNRSASLNIVVERDPHPLPVPVKDPEPLTSPTSSSLSEESKEGGTVIIDNTPVKLRNKRTLRARGHSPNRRRSKSPSPCPSTRQKVIDLSRSRSFTSQNFDHRVFRPTDLVTGEILGQGFFGRAMKAKHKVTGEYMVLKELHNFDEDAQKGFLTEVSMLRNLSHSCVLKFMGVLYRDKKLTLVTEYIDGGTLSDLLLNDSVTLSWIQRLKLVKDIANGMSYLHSMDVIHRDLNSGNCFVRKDQSVVVGDFGLAKIFPRHSFSNLFPRMEEPKGDGKGGKLSRKKTSRKKRQTVVGNPYWMAPEMIVSKGVYDEKVDIFSYGVIMFETIARVTADPDYLPRSLDFGVNVEAFHRRFCQHAPEPYTMLAMLCSLIEPDKRPSFEEIEVWCESLHLHLEHGSSVPQELKGSTVELYRATKERLYGIDYRDVDSVEDALKHERKPTDQSGNPVPNDSATINNNVPETSSSCTTNVNVNVPDKDSPPHVSKGPSNLNSTRVCHSDSSSVIPPGVHQPTDPEHSKLNKSFPADMNSDPSVHHPSPNTCDTTGEDSTYFSCSSSSSMSLPSSSSSSVAAQSQGFHACKSSTNSCSCPQDSNNSSKSQGPHLNLSTTRCSCPRPANAAQIQQLSTAFQHQHCTCTKEDSLTNPSFYCAETETESETDVPDPLSLQQSQSYFLHLDHCVHSDTNKTPESENLEDGDSDKHTDDIPDNQHRPSSNVDEESSLSTTNVGDHSKPEDMKTKPWDRPSQPIGDHNKPEDMKTKPWDRPSHPMHLNIVDDDKSKLLLSLDRCHSPIHESYMCSSRRRQKKVRNSMNLDQASPNLSPQPKASLDWSVNASNNSSA